MGAFDSSSKSLHRDVHMDSETLLQLPLNVLSELFFQRTGRRVAHCWLQVHIDSVVMQHTSRGYQSGCWKWDNPSGFYCILLTDVESECGTVELECVVKKCDSLGCVQNSFNQINQVLSWFFLPKEYFFCLFSLKLCFEALDK